jgi:hypothetical protein
MGTATKKSSLTPGERARLEAMKPQERFGRNGYSMMPHAYFTVLGRKCSGWAQHFAIGYIMDRTFGAPNNPDWAKISLATLARLTGLTSQAFSLALEDAVSRGLVERKEAGTGWLYRTWPESWISAAEYKPQERIAATEDAATEDAATEDAATEDAATATSVSCESGRSAKPIVLSIQIKDVAAPVPLKFQARNEAGLPLVFSTSTKGGTVRFVVSRGELKGEGKANSYQVQLIVPPSPDSKNQRLSELRAFVKDILDAEWNKRLDEPFFTRLAAALGPDAPIDHFRVHTSRELAGMKAKRKTTTSGLLDYFAQQVRAKWDDGAAERRALDQITTTAAAKAARNAPLFRALQQLGDCLADFRLISDNPDAEFEDWEAAQRALYVEFGAELPSHLAE